MQVLSDLVNGELAIEPYEAGWADEAIAWIYVRERHGEAVLKLRPQISIDGCRWIDAGPPIPPIRAVGGYYAVLAHFGNWIRLAGSVHGGPEDGSPAMVVDFYWSLKG
jgi:hypothetical protein